MSTLRACDLRSDVVYVSPRGLLVRLVPATLRGLGSGGECFHFAYLAQPASRSRSEPEGFWFSARNVGLLRPGAKV
jgi:hypothetical protein